MNPEELRSFFTIAGQVPEVSRRRDQMYAADVFAVRYRSGLEWSESIIRASWDSPDNLRWHLARLRERIEREMAAEYLTRYGTMIDQLRGRAANFENIAGPRVSVPVKVQKASGVSTRSRLNLHGSPS